MLSSISASVERTICWLYVGRSVRTARGPNPVAHPPAIKASRLAHAAVREGMTVARTLPAELGERFAHGGAGEIDESLVGLIHFEDQEDCAGDRERADDQRRDRGGVARREQTEARE